MIRPGKRPAGISHTDVGQHQVDRGKQVGHCGSERGAGERRRKLSGAVAGHPERGQQEPEAGAVGRAAGQEYRTVQAYGSALGMGSACDGRGASGKGGERA